MRRALILVPLLVALLAGTVGMTVISYAPRLVAHGPTTVDGTEASAVFRIGGRTVRQVRYDDGGTLSYTFELENEGRLPVTVTGLATLRTPPRLFRYLTLTDSDGDERFTVGGGERTTVRLSMLMQGCETLSARAGSFATEVHLLTEVAGTAQDVVAVYLPEEVHTGSPREAFCPNATAMSRPPG